MKRRPLYLKVPTLGEELDELARILRQAYIVDERPAFISLVNAIDAAGAKKKESYELRPRA